jgi:hypothetical protein
VRQGTAPGYNGDFGSRERYTLSYRDGFRDGYETPSAAATRGGNS